MAGSIGSGHVTQPPAGSIELVRVAEESNIVKIALLGWPELGNDLVADAIQARGDLIVGLAIAEYG